MYIYESHQALSGHSDPIVVNTSSVDIIDSTVSLSYLRDMNPPNILAIKSRSSVAYYLPAQVLGVCLIVIALLCCVHVVVIQKSERFEKAITDRDSFL